MKAFCVPFTMDARSLILKLVESMDSLVKRASPSERMCLQHSLRLLRPCADIKPHPCVVSLLQYEILEQLDWMVMYCNYQQQEESYIIPSDDSIVTRIQDNEYTLYQFSVEALEGAKTICLIMDQTTEVSSEWIVVGRRNVLALGNYDVGRGRLDEEGGEEGTGPEEGKQEPAVEDGDSALLYFSPRLHSFWYF